MGGDAKRGAGAVATTTAAAPAAVFDDASKPLLSASTSSSATPPASGEDRVYSWAEVKKHQSWTDAWTVIDGSVYDMTPFVRAHPGGKLIMAAAGRDGTPLYQIHHPYSTRPDQQLRRMRLGTIEGRDWYPRSEFYAELLRRMKKGGLLTKQSIRDDHAMIFKAGLCVAAWMLCFYLGWVKGYTLACLGFGLAKAFIGMLVMHDGNHQGTSVSWFNFIAGEMMTVMGGCSQQWTFAHILHHQSPNQHDDPDTFQAPGVLRYREDEPIFWYMRYQHIYGWALYSLVFLKKKMQAIQHIFNPHVFEDMPLPSPNPWFHTWTSGMFVVDAIVTVALPIYWHGIAWFFPRWLLAELLGGLLLGLVFQVNHITAECELRPGTYRNPKNDWAIDQILGSSDFTQGSHRSFLGWLVGHLTGGLGYQIEHHLFPCSSHTRLPDIYDYVRPLCVERGIKHVTFPSWRSALASHHELLVHCGPAEWARRQEKQQHKAKST